MELIKKVNLKMFNSKKHTWTWKCVRVLSTKAMGLFLNYHFLAHNFNEESFVIGKLVKNDPY